MAPGHTTVVSTLRRDTLAYAHSARPVNACSDEDRCFLLRCYRIPIRGDSLKEAVNQFHDDDSLKNSPGHRTLELRKLLRRFLDVCNAIDYAHSRGVLHRDIKPANIIVGKHGETLVVDWGLAKVLGRSDSDSGSVERALIPKSSSGSSETLPGSALGTPAYMSPEQARGDLDQVSTRSDVYSLGATLYFLLTGKTPLEGSDIGAVLRAAQEGRFPPPRKHDPSIDKALEAVCLRAMALSPEDRYATPKALADDLERWMADEPVLAWREPWSRSLVRWLTRHRTGVTAMGATLLMALAGLVAVLGVQTRANAQLTAKNAELDASVKRETERFNLAMDAIKLFHGDVSEDLLLKEKEFEKLRAKLLRGAAGFYGKLDRLLAGQSDDASRAALGKAYAELGKLTGDIGTESDALDVHQKALAVRRELAKRVPDSAEAALDLARTLTDIGNLHSDPGDLAGAMEPLKEAQELAEKVEASGRGSDAGRYVLARALYGQGVKLMRLTEPAKATGVFDRATAILQALFDAHPDDEQFQWGLASALDGQAHLLSDPAQALAVYRRELVIREKLAAANPDGSGFQNSLAITHNNIAGRLEELGRLSEAVASARRAVAIWQAAADAYPAVTSVQSNVSFGLYGLGQALANLGRWEEALAALQRAKVILRRQLVLDPTQAANKRGLATVLGQIGLLLQQTGHPEGALAEFEQEFLVRNELASPGNARAQNSLATCEVNKAAALLVLGRPAEARISCDRSIVIREALFKASPADVGTRTGLAASLLRSGQVRRATGDFAGAAADWRRAIALYEGLPPRSNDVAVFEAGCHAMLSGLAEIAGSGLTASDRTSEADRALAILRAALAAGFRTPALATEAALAPLRTRPEFPLLIMDAVFPPDPFVD